jgi:hypothetical protein
LISKNSSSGGGWKIFSKENVGNVSYVLKRREFNLEYFQFGNLGNNLFFHKIKSIVLRCRYDNIDLYIG